ncbi:MAG TPA: potassium-transporting ATPase subunit KdpA [Pseudonocardia sp.]
MAAQRPTPASVGTLPTHRPLFVAMLIGVIVIVVGLTYFPAQALGPIAEGLS